MVEPPRTTERHLVRPVIVVLVVLVSLFLSVVCSPLEAQEQAAKQLKSSEWNFDNQALRSIPSKLLCNPSQSAASQRQTSQPQEAEAKQQVNVVTFVGNRINSIEHGAFRCVASELRILVLTSNEIENIPAGTFEALHAVQVLLLDNNQLSSIPSEEALGPLQSLRHLNLADNRIEQLAGWSFGSHLSGLISLNLAGNPLLQVHPSSLAHLVKLKTLTLSRCSNGSFAQEPLEALQELKFLHLDRAQPKRSTVTSNLCQQSPKLSSLLLKSNSIERVPQFVHCQNLLLLDLSYNNIRGPLEGNSIAQLPNLIDLYLGNNQLESIASSALIGLKKLQVLELQNNRLKQIDPEAFLPVQPTLEELNLSHNPQLTKLSPSGLDRLRSLKCYGNHQLRELPHFESATQLALTYAYHCCDYPVSRSSSASTSTSTTADHTNFHPDRSSLIVRLLHSADQQEHHSGQQEEEDNSELILWPPLTNRHAKSRHRRADNSMMDDKLLILEEIKKIRRLHSIFESPTLAGGGGDNKTQQHGRHGKTRRDVTRTKLDKEVRCIPSPSAFLPCKDLFDSWWLRVGIWSVFLLAFLGNTLVIIVLSSVRQTSSSSALTSIMWLAHSKRHIDVPRFLVINLAIADLLMAIYLGLLAFVDLSTLGEFRLHAIRWQYSTGCKLAGFLAVLSSELSVFILAIITLERNYAITNAVHLNRRLSLQKAMVIMFLGYAFALAMAVMPLYGISDYRRFSVCLPLDVDTNLGSQIYVITLISINTFSFVLLLGCYLRMYFAIRGSQAWNANDLRIAKRMSILVVTDFLCWMPIIASGLTSLFGYHLIGTDGMKVLTIFILPLNSVANPFLYAITTKKFKRDLCTLHRRTRALVRFECFKPASQMDTNNHYHQQHAKLHNYHDYQHQMKLNNQQCLTNSHKNHHFRHDLLLTSHQFKGGTRSKMRLVCGDQQATAGAQRRLARSSPKSIHPSRPIHRPATPLVDCHTCVNCSCRQQQQNQASQQQQHQIHPRIVLESATQTSGRHLLAQTQPRLLRKSRSANSGLVTTHHGYLGQESFMNDDGLTKVEESMMMTGDELYWRQDCRSICDDEYERKHSPLSVAASTNTNNLLLVQQQAIGTGGGPARAAACSRFHLSVDPFQVTQAAAAAAAAAAIAGGADIRSASACGHLASCRVAESVGDRQIIDGKCQPVGSTNNKRLGVSGSCDTVRVTGGGGAVKLSRSIQRLLFGPLAKAWSSIQISLNSSVATHIGGQQQPVANQNAASCDLTSDRKRRTNNNDNQFPEGDCLDEDILMMGSPLKGSMRIGERRMSRSCDAIPKFANDLLQLNSPSHSSGQEQSSSHCDYDDDQRVLLATINRLNAGNNRRRANVECPSARPTNMSSTGLNPMLITRGRCTRCRSWSPALLTKLENCIYQMKSRIGSGFGGAQNGTGATKFEQEFHEQSTTHESPISEQNPAAADETANRLQGLEREASSESEIELGPMDEDDSDGLDSLDDQFGEPPDWIMRRERANNRKRRPGKSRRRGLRQQSSINSDTLSTRTAGTLVTNMSLSSDSNASIQLAASAGAAAAAATNQPTKRLLDIITDAQDDVDEEEDNDDIVQ